MIIKTNCEIYLDANATTPVLPAAVKEAHDTMQQIYGNPSSTHTSGLRAKNILESTRELCRRVLGAPCGQIIFTSGATEAIQLAIFSTLCQLRERKPKPGDQQRVLLYGATEHKAVPQALKHWNRLLGVNRQIVEIPVDQNGLLDLDFISRYAGLTDMVCTMAVNNETGVLTDLKGVEQAIRSQNPDVSWMVDSVQAVGKFELKLEETTIDYAPISGHKIYAPKGIGLLYARQDACIVPLLAGGGQEQGARAGTENLPGVAAISAIFRLLAQSENRAFGDHQQLEKYRQCLVEQLKKSFPSIVFNAPFEHSLPTTINFSVKGFSSKELLDLFDAAGIRVSSGSACGSAVERSFVLDAMGVAPWQSEGAIRMSFGPLTTKQEIEAACQQIDQAGQALCESCLVVSPDPNLDKEPLDGLIQLKNGSSCSYLIMNSDQKCCLVIDPIPELAERIESLIRCQHSRVLGVLDTDFHPEHQAGRSRLLSCLEGHDCQLASSDDPLGWPDRVDGRAILGDGSEAPYLRLSDQMVLAQTALAGYSGAGRGLLLGKLDHENRLLPDNIQFAFLGNTVLIGGIGRTDLSAGDPQAMFHSLRRLPKLISAGTVICPTYDYLSDFSTSLACETASNQFLEQVIDPLSEMTFDEFVKRKSEIDAQIEDHSSLASTFDSSSGSVCGLIRREWDLAILEVARQDLPGIARQHPKLIVVDVREPHEFVFSSDFDCLGIDCPIQNIPLTRLVGAVPELRQKVLESEGWVLFLCRSGKRSAKAAEVARRLGLNQARHISGGLALSSNQLFVSAAQSQDHGFVI
jgi:cysteine desulfurase